MGVFQTVAVLALRQFVDRACSGVGIGGAGKVVDLLAERFSDHSQILTAALHTANERAWKAVEIALAGDSLLDRCKVVLARGEDQAFRDQVRDFIAVSPFRGRSPESTRVFPAALKELRTARASGYLGTGKVSFGELAQQVDTFARFDNQQGILEAEWKTVDQVAVNLPECYPNLRRVLAIRPRSNSGLVNRPSILAVAVRFYFRREIETNQQLFQGLTISKLESLEETQQKGFAALSKAMETQGQRLEQIMDEVLAVVYAIKETTEDTNIRVRGIEEQIQKFLAQYPLQNREVRRSDSLSVRSDEERQFVNLLVAQYRALPEAERRRQPVLLSNVGKLELVAGNVEAAHQDFQAVATLTTEPKAKAEALHNAYQAALECQQWEEALAALQQAIALDADRFIPFPLDRYAPKRILGAGGFGVVFLCQDCHLDQPVVVKSLLISELNRDVTDVFAEAKALSQLDHQAIIRLRDCNYADTAKTRPYLVMDYFDGVSFDNYVNTQGLLSPPDLITIALPVVEALQATHARGILHRDIKPANLLVKRDGPDWRIKLIDFGLAVRSETLQGTDSTRALRGQTTTGKSIAGTLNYAAPEQMGQLSGVAVGPYSDVFAFGKTCYFALCQTPEPDDVEKDGLPDSLRKFLSRCTGRIRANRFPDFAAVRSALHDLSAGNLGAMNFGTKAKAASDQKKSRRPRAVTSQEDSSPPAQLLFLKSKGVVAEGRETDDKFEVLAGSQAVTDAVPSAPAHVVELRHRLLHEKVLIASKDNLILSKDYSFESASTAASVMLGRSANGRIEWKDGQGRQLKELEAMEVVEPPANNPTSVAPEEEASQERAQSDKPVSIRWRDDARNNLDTRTWKDVLILATEKAIALGLGPADLPMPTCPTGSSLRSPREVRTDLYIESNASALIKSWVSAMLRSVGKRSGFLEIVTRSGNVVALPD